MAWFRNHYRCGRCKRSWTDEWSCMCDDDCPHCGARHMSPTASDDLTVIVRPHEDGFAVLVSPDSAGHSPDYVTAKTFPDEGEARAYAAAHLKQGGADEQDP